MNVANFSISKIQEFFPKLKIEKIVGRGGQKQVFKAIEGSRDVALKIIKLNTDNNIERQLKRISRELKAMINVKSPHLVELFAANYIKIEEIWYFYLIEEFLEGKTLRELITANTILTKEELIQIGVCLLKAIEELWNHKIVHRDIKPENIIINNEKKACLIDLGIAQFKEDSTITIPFFGRGPGTSGYMAPELLNYEKELQSIRTDIFSIGISLIEVYTGNNPFEITDSNNTKDENILMGKTIDLNKYFEDENCLLDCLTSMIKLNPYERPTNAKKAISNLKGCLSNG